MSYPNPDSASLPAQEARKVIHSLPANISLETIQDELHKQGFATIPSTLTNTSQIYIPPSQFPKETHPKKQKKSACSIQ